MSITFKMRMASTTWWPTVLFTAPGTSRISTRQRQSSPARVPGTLDEALQAIQNTDLADLKPLSDGYRAREKISEYGDVKQRWLIIYSDAAADRASESAANRRDREHEGEKRDLHELGMREFSCREDAEKALSAFEEGLTGSVWAEKQVLRATRFTIGEEDIPVETGEASYLLRGTLVPSEDRLAKLVKKKSFFIVATNELYKERLSGKELLESERRIMALLMVMTLCLLVYAALQWHIRKGLKETGRSYPDQNGESDQRPTARWVFQSFEGIHVLHTGKQEFILNLEEYHKTVVSILGPEYERLYVSQPT